MLKVTFIRIWFIILTFLTTSSAIIAQQASFIYFQSENNLPYQIQWKGQTYPSSASGYLVIPQVMPGEHSLVVAFAPGIAPEYAYRLTITDKPRGFSIRQSADNQWSLFDMIDFSSVQGNALVKQPKPVDTDKLVEQPPTTPTPTVEKKPVEPASQPVVEKKPVELPNTSVKPADLTVTKKEVSVPLKESSVRSVVIQKIFDKESTSGVDQVYIVQNGSKSDTIALFIPVLKEDLPKQIPGQVAANGSKPRSTSIQGHIDWVFVNRYYGTSIRNGSFLK